MATLAASSFNSLHDFHTGLRPPHHRSSSHRFQKQLRLNPSSRLLCCRASSDRTSTEEPGIKKDSSGEDKSTMVSVSRNTEVAVFPNKSINRRIALVSTVSAVGLFASSRLEFGVSQKDLAANAVSYEEALSNGKPTVVEFYADWCEVCREIAPDVYNVKQQYKDRVNFVMLNVDNTKWEQELDEFGVEGIPHFAFLDKDGNEEGNIVGRIRNNIYSKMLLLWPMEIHQFHMPV